MKDIFAPTVRRAIYSAVVLAVTALIVAGVITMDQVTDYVTVAGLVVAALATLMALFNVNEI